MLWALGPDDSWVDSNKWKPSALRVPPFGTDRRRELTRMLGGCGQARPTRSAPPQSPGASRRGRWWRSRTTGVDGRHRVAALALRAGTALVPADGAAPGPHHAGPPVRPAQGHPQPDPQPAGAVATSCPRRRRCRPRRLAATPPSATASRTGSSRCWPPAALAPWSSADSWRGRGVPPNCGRRGCGRTPTPISSPPTSPCCRTSQHVSGTRVPAASLPGAARPPFRRVLTPATPVPDSQG